MTESSQLSALDAPLSTLRDWDNAHVWHPFCQMSDYRADDAPIIAAGDGFELIDVEGRRYLDGVSSLWCNVHGHRVPEIDAAIREQLDRIGHSTLLGLANQPSIELAQALVERAATLECGGSTPLSSAQQTSGGGFSPDRVADESTSTDASKSKSGDKSPHSKLTKVFYSDSGATAVEVALKLAYQFHRQKPNPEPRDTFVGLSAAYHGDTIGTVSVGNIELFQRTYSDLLFRALRVPAPASYRLPPGFDAVSYLEFCDAEIQRVLAAEGHRIAAFVIEPLVQGAAGILVHPRGYLRRVRELTQRHGILLIADEVAVGFGRTGTLFACEQEQVTPDFLCLAKGITGGYLPLAATLTTDAVYEAFLGPTGSGRTFFHGHTYTGNPLGCAAALASLRLFERNRVLDNVAEVSRLLERRLAKIHEWPHVGDIRQQGVMVGIELVADKTTKQPFASEQRVGHRVTLEARHRGVFTRPLGDVIVLMPAPAMPPELADRLCDVLFESIAAAIKSLGGDVPNFVRRTGGHEC